MRTWWLCLGCRRADVFIADVLPASMICRFCYTPGLVSAEVQS